MSGEPDEIGNTPFTLARRGGYERDEVDALIDSLQRRIAELEARPTPGTAVTRALEQVGENVTAVLQQAHETAEEIVASAEREAAAEREVAAAEVAAVTAQAEQRVRELDLDADRIWAERERLVDDVRELAQRLLQLVDGASARFPAEPAGPSLSADPVASVGTDDVDLAYRLDDAGAPGLS